MDGFPPFPPGDDDDHDDLAALDFSTAEDDGGESDLDAFDVYAPSQQGPDAGVGTWSATDPTTQDEDEDDDDDDDELESPVFLVTNPPGTVSVTAYMDGRVDQIDLSAGVTTMTETDLAKEIVVIAGLAREKARSAQYLFISEIMQGLGQGAEEAREFVGQTMGLPSPEQAQAEVAKVFATRYASDHE